MIWISITCIILAAICNAIMDTSVHHFSTSIFKSRNPLWWNGEESWKNKYINGDQNIGRVKWIFGLNKPVQITDAFHFFKMLMIIFICLSIVTFDSSILLLNGSWTWYLFLIFVGIYGILWNTAFSLFYNRILK